MNVECVWPAEAELGEGPVWIDSEQALYWVDILKQTLHCFKPETASRQSWPMAPYISAILPTAIQDSAPVLVGCFADGVALLRNGKRIPLINPEPQRPDNRLNDAWIDPYGNLWFGTMQHNCADQRGKFYRLDPDLNLQALPQSFDVTNGPTFSAKQSCGYFVDTHGRCILRAKIDTQGLVGELEPWLHIPAENGSPDGITLDSEDHLWVAHYRGARVARYTPDGELERTIHLPALNVTKCAFGGPNLSTLYITTARAGMTKKQLAQYPLSGSLLAVELSDVTGSPTPEFALEHWPCS